MTLFTVYDSAGRILRSGKCQEDCLEAQARAGEFVLEAESDDLTDWVTGGQITQRPANPATLDRSMLTNLPTPCVIKINNDSYDCADSTAQLDFTYPGKYKIRVTAFPYLDAAFDVTTR